MKLHFALPLAAALLAQEKPTPDLANVAYGPHERNVLDFWKAPDSAAPAPIMVFIHGGGFVAGDKRTLDPALLDLGRKQGWHVASINYRYSTIAPYPGPMLDGARAIQFLRSKAGEWKIDPRNVFLTGGSAGAAMSLWLAFHDDLAEPGSPDPVRRQSTRVTATALRGAQSYVNPIEVAEKISPVTARHPALPALFGLRNHEEAMKPTPAVMGLYRDASAIEWLSRGDPPSLLFYGEGPEPVPADAKPGAGIHHIRFGYRLKEEMDKLGIECVVRHAKDYGTEPVPKFHQETIAFFKKHIRAAANPDSLVSPEVHSDRRVTFRIHAPQAKDVAFVGDWMTAGQRERMQRDSSGTWSTTLGPLAPSVYIYTFNVDGVAMADPVNPRIKLRARTSASMVDVPPDQPALWEARDVPHGSVEINWQKSTVLGDTRWIWVYTPPGYHSQPGRKYPVLYLFHGSNDIAGGWTLAGHANFIADNLIAAKRSAPMIIVMPFGHAVPFGSPRELQATNTAKFEEYVLKDVMPLVEAKYRVTQDRASRAVAGLSMGGGHSLTVGLKHTDLFSSIGAFSAAAPAELGDLMTPALNAKLKNFWVGIGKDDFLLKRNREFVAQLNAKGVRNTYRETEGAHTYRVWRDYLGEFLPLLFQ
jgi:enterochelin esterase family protein